MLEKNNISDYGWRSTDSPYLTQYLQPAIVRLIHNLQPVRILDLGCGNGKLCSILTEQPCTSLVGVDIDAGGIQIARKTYPDISFFNYGVEDDPQTLLDQVGDKFDCVISTEVVEHLYSPARLPQYAAAVLQPKGKLLVTTPYHGYLKNLALAILGKWDSHLDPLWEGGHIKFWSKQTITTLMSQHGFTLIDFSGVGRCPYLWMSMIAVFEKQ